MTPKPAKLSATKKTPVKKSAPAKKNTAKKVEKAPLKDDSVVKVNGVKDQSLRVRMLKWFK